MERTIHVCFVFLSIMILGFGLFGPNTGNTMGLIALLALAALIIFDIFTPTIAKLPPEHPKTKMMRRLNRFSMLFIAVIFSFMTWLPVMTDIQEEMIGTAIAVVVMVVIGNAAPKIPFNRYMGLRLPWTIRDEATWRAAHKLLGAITFPLVCILIIGSIFGEPAAFIKYTIIAWVAIPGIYSAWFFYLRMKGRR